jgi:hypothetical protein
MAGRMYRSEQGPDEHGGHAPDDDRGGHGELHVAEGQGAEGGCQRQGHGLGEIGADQLVGPQ